MCARRGREMGKGEEAEKILKFTLKKKEECFEIIQMK